MMEYTDPQNLASESLENQGPQKAKTLQFEQVNEVTIKVTDGGGIIQWDGSRSGGSRTTRAVAWLIGVGNGRWVVRYRNKHSRLLKLPAARRYALEMIRGIRPGRTVEDTLAELNRIQAIVQDYSSDSNRAAARS
jgi:hypothetical protein